MKPPLKLSKNERLYFLQALNAVAFQVGSEKKIWEKHLDFFSRLFDERGFAFNSAVPGIAEKLNKISDPKVRLYFLRIIQDIHKEEINSRFIWRKNKGLSAFGELFLELTRKVN